MCGIFGVVAFGTNRVKLTDAHAAALRDRLHHRGPDAAGLWRSDCGRFLLAHRRLAVLDPTDAGAQPFVLADAAGRPAWVIAYNGELYNDAELRRELHADGVRFRSACDTETVAAALARWGSTALDRLRGMYAVAAVNLESGRLLLARDPLGIKPLYWWSDGTQVVFASEPGPIVQHPDVTTRPDLVTVSAYLTTIRTTLGPRTLFEGVRTLEPGEAIEFAREGVRASRYVAWPVVPGPGCGEVQAADLRSEVTDSVRRHLRADVPACALLSGGLDSSIIVAACRDLAETGTDGVGLRTYSSGHDDGRSDGDPAFARLVAVRFGTVHTEAPVNRAMFRERWPEMVRRQQVPLSTPNEVAINQVARRLRADGQIVALSGEGADELFGGYELPMRQAWEHEQRRREDSRLPAEHGGLFQLAASAWVTKEMKAAMLRPEVWKALEQDAALETWYRETFDSLRRESAGVQTHLEFHRRINLAGLLQRLDTATMLEGVEGRTPFADVRIAALARSLPLERKFQPPSRTKIALRQAFSTMLPREVVERPKASFPLPFQEWLEDHARALRSSRLAADIFTPQAIDAVCARPSDCWRMAWPMINLALWGERWGAG